MRLPKKDKVNLQKRLQKISSTPASFAFYVALHDFIDYIEANHLLAGKPAPVKYTQLKQVYQGVEDTMNHSDKDLGHERYMVIQDLNRIRGNDFSEGNPLWKKRESLRDWAEEAYKMITQEEVVKVAEEV